jgi:NAD(P)-dependent dehydrogenase (short-subunit alcohol dehydrogenase family)
MDQSLQNKVALISGAARGIGASEARLLAARGAKVVLGDELDNAGRTHADEAVSLAGRGGSRSPLSLVRDALFISGASADWWTAVPRQCDESMMAGDNANGAAIASYRDARNDQCPALRDL